MVRFVYIVYIVYAKLQCRIFRQIGEMALNEYVFGILYFSWHNNIV